MKEFKDYFSKSEIVLWSSSVMVIIISFCVFDRINYMTLCASLIGVTSLIFNAKGNPFGQLLMVVFSLLYGIISYTFSYYGEMITYLGMTMPMAIFALISWLKNPYNGNKAEVKVNSIGKRENVCMWIVTFVVTFLFYLILKCYFLKITHEARLLGTDARLIDKDAPNNPDGKLNKVAENVWKEYEKGNANGHIGCQLIFSDIGTPGPDKDFTIYDYLKETLIQYGIPADEIAFIHDAKTDAQRDALFKEMRTGKKKVLIGSTDKCGTGVNVQTHLVAMHHVDCPWKPSSIEQREGRGIRQGNENEEVAIYRYVTKGTFDAYNWSLVENKQRFISQVMTSKAVSRSCEDIDEATLSYAEIKAVATGNPLIKEKMEIDNDVQRLKLLKASYDNQRYGLQDNFMIKYPKLIKTATEKLANVREDVKARDKELIDNPEFAITIGKATYTERVDGGTMMLEAISKCKTGETTAIGKFHGFELLVEKNFLGINYMVLQGKTEYKAELSTSPVGSMVKLENLFNGLHENIDFLEKKIEQYQNDLEASKTEYDKPFAYSKELEEKLARQCELNAQLDLENAKAVDADLSGPEEEREADDRMESAAIVAEDKGAYQADREGRTR